MTTTHRGATDPIGAALLRLLKTLKLGALADTLPERAALARQHKLSHIGFLETLLADEVSRRESRSAALRATKAGLDPGMRSDTWTAHDDSVRLAQALVFIRGPGTRTNSDASMSMCYYN